MTPKSKRCTPRTTLVGKEVIHETGVEPEQIVNYIGKEPAKKLMEEVRNYGSVGDTSEWNVERNTEPNSEGLYEYSVRDPNGDVWHDRSGKPETFASEQEARHHIQSMADQDKVAQGFPKLSGLDLKVGGEWAKNLYDKAVPNFLNKYAKKWGAKVGETTLESRGAAALKMKNIVRDVLSGRFQVQLSDGDLWGSFSSEAAAQKAYNEEFQPEGQKVHSIEITPAMKKSVLQEGQPISRNAPTFDWRSAVTGQAA